MSSPHVRQSPRLKEQRQQQQQQPDYFPAVTHEADVLSPPPSHQHAAFGQHAAEGLAGGASSSGGSPARPGSNISSLAVQAVHRQQALEWAQWGVKVMLLMWTTAIGWGYLNHADSDEKPNKELTLPLLWFDRQVLRRFGAFLPLLVLALRCWSSIEAVTIHGRRIPFPTWACLYIYITLSRLGVYVIHAAGSLQWVNNFFPAEVATSDHMMSDHVFLTASIATILMCEAIFILLRIRQRLHGPATPQQTSRIIYVPAAVCAVLYVLVVGDAYYSARYFHWRTHNNSAAVIGLLGFQLPALWILGFGRPLIRWLLHGDNLRLRCPAFP